MIMAPGLRKLALTAHLTTSVGWMGAIAAFLALAVVGLASDDGQRARAAYVAMDMTTRFVIVPLSAAALVTGIAQSLGTPWGLFHHYWVLIKLVLTILATVVLMIHTRPIEYMARVAAETALSIADYRRIRIQLVIDAAAGLAVLLVATVLAVYKPRGLTRWGRRKQHDQAEGGHA